MVFVDILKKQGHHAGLFPVQPPVKAVGAGIVQRVFAAGQGLADGDVLHGHRGVLHLVVQHHEYAGAPGARVAVKVKPGALHVDALHEFDEGVDHLRRRPGQIRRGQAQVAEALALHRFLLRHAAVHGDFCLTALLVVRHPVGPYGLADQPAEALPLGLPDLFQRLSGVGPVVLGVPGDGVAVEKHVALLAQVDHIDPLALGQLPQGCRQLVELGLGKLGAAGDVQPVQALGAGGVVLVDAIAGLGLAEFVLPLGQQPQVGDLPLPGVPAVPVHAKKPLVVRPRHGARPTAVPTSTNRANLFA